MSNPNGERRAALPGRWGDIRRRPQPCMDCDVDCEDEYYVIRHDLWREAVGRRRGFLCVPCLEARLDRRLDPDDFLPCGANDLDWRKTDRLRERMTRS
jgi:hypothetical protein